MTDHGSPQGARSSRAQNNTSAQSGFKSAFSSIKANVTSTVDAAKVLSRLTPKQVKDEVQIAKLELKAKGISLAKGAAIAAVGLLFGCFLLIALVAAAILGLGKVMEPWLAALVLALVFLILLAIFAFIGYKMIMKQLPFKPESALFGILYDIGVLKHGSAMTSSRLRREQEQKAAEKKEQKAAKAAAQEEEKKEAGELPAASKEQLKLRTQQRREHLKSLRDDVQNYSKDVQSQVQGLVGGAKSSARQAPSQAAAEGRQLADNIKNPEYLQARWGSFATLAASLGAFMMLLLRLLRRGK